MKSVLMSISPYLGFLIIAEDRGWDLAKYGLYKKTIEVRKHIPTSPDWDKKIVLYFTKDKKSLQRIPKEYRDEVAKLCNKVVCNFICDDVLTIDCDSIGPFCKEWDSYCEMETGLSAKELFHYSRYVCKGLHISDLKVYKKPFGLKRENYSELYNFNKPCKYFNNEYRECEKECGPVCKYCYDWTALYSHSSCLNFITNPPKGWCYVED